MNLDKRFINEVEESHFRTEDDTGANLNALLIWNLVRKHVGFDPLRFEDLPAYCVTHDTYHLIRSGYDCKRKPKE